MDRHGLRQLDGTHPGDPRHRARHLRVDRHQAAKIGVHIALVVALLGVIGTFSRVLQLGDLFAGTAEVPLAVISSTLTFILLIAYIVAGVRSFIAARRTPKDAEAA